VSVITNGFGYGQGNVIRPIIEIINELDVELLELGVLQVDLEEVTTIDAELLEV
jgi:hypothetical protein